MATAVPNDLYTLACRANEFFDYADGFAEAFDSCFDPEGSGRLPPDLILQRVWSTLFWIGLYIKTHISDPFWWRVVWVNPKGIRHGPYPEDRTGVVVIEDNYNDFSGWGPELDEPVYSTCAFCP